MSAFESDEKWHIKKDIPLLGLIFLLMNLAAVMFFGGKLLGLVEQIPEMDKRITHVEMTRFKADDAALMRQLIIAEFKAEIAPMVEQIRRNREDITHFKQEKR